MSELEKEIREIGKYLGCNENELINELRILLQNISVDEILEFTYEE